MINIGVFISGKGSNLREIIKREHKKNIIVQVVFSDKPTSGLNYALEAKIPIIYLPKINNISRENYDNKIVSLLKSFDIDYIALAGYMRILTDNILDAYPNRIINIHPSLLPKFKGLNTYQRALDAQEKNHGATVHIVTNKLDDGPIIAQKSINIDTNETCDSLKKKTQRIEYELYSYALEKLSKNHKYQS